MRFLEEFRSLIPVAPSHKMLFVVGELRMVLMLKGKKNTYIFRKIETRFQCFNNPWSTLHNQNNKYSTLIQKKQPTKKNRSFEVPPGVLWSSTLVFVIEVDVVQRKASAMDVKGGGMTRYTRKV